LAAFAEIVELDEPGVVLEGEDLARI